MMLFAETSTASANTVPDIRGIEYRENKFQGF